MDIRSLFRTTLAVTGLFAASATIAAEQVNIYSYRQPFLIEPVLDKFTEATGIETKVVFASKGLNERLQREGRNSPADLVLTSNTSSLMDLLAKDLTQPVQSDVLEKNIPAQFRDEAGNWFGLTTRARLIYASKDRVKPGEITRYEELADPKWKGRICTRSGKHPYNLSLFASMIAHHGEAETKQWLEGVKANLARKPQGNDRAQVKAISEGVCDLSLGNSYYFGNMITNTEQPEQIEWAKSVNLVFPNQQDRGTHMFISGAALTRHAPNRDNAIKLLEFLSGPEAQYLYAEKNFEFPVRPGTPRSELINQYMGEFKEDDLSLTEIGSHVPAASRLVDEVGFDF
ncbi:iron(III) transport system substrate-binding protein [Microbulbifer donghaiensis]|uniref:Iron(III) transport system substrate-binding protein n=1 Tax=Microbulbifer donghaiensis TaxID=494016 RepID=A0A1M5FZL1_9GAMM|nr:Fe(3+) ABC transporter substrate-binding protein [Microbulbifer donghaiensis]SHF96602.1 iron(III) transport system substrate-binding protein [Microbulbifer donghaiensis]